jgi:cellobiose phosphorylase
MIPEKWDGFTARRMFRGTHYEIHVKRVGPGDQVRVALDGIEIPDRIVPVPKNKGQTVVVNVQVGIESSTKGNQP